MTTPYQGDPPFDRIVCANAYRHAAGRLHRRELLRRWLQRGAFLAAILGGLHYGLTTGARRAFAETKAGD